MNGFSVDVKLVSQRIYATRKQFSMGGNEPYVFSGTVILTGNNTGFVRHREKRIPVVRPGRSWHVDKSWKTPQMALFGEAAL